MVIHFLWIEETTGGEGKLALLQGFLAAFSVFYQVPAGFEGHWLQLGLLGCNSHHLSSSV